MTNKRKSPKIVKSLEEKWEEKQKKKLKLCTCGHANFSVARKCSQHLNLHDFFHRFQKTKKVY
jgi:hypothetical protein